MEPTEFAGLKTSKERSFFYRSFALTKHEELVGIESKNLGMIFVV